MFFYSEMIENIIKNWKEKQVLSGSLATNAYDSFGASVAINSTGDRIVVGAERDQRSGGSSSEGLAYVFVSGASGWTQQHILSGTLAADNSDFFGISVAMNATGDRIIVGAHNDERNGQSSTKNEGLAYVFVSGTGGWTQQHILSGTLATNANDLFGWSVSMNSSGDRVVIGAPQDEISGGSLGEGRAYVFVSGASGWTEQHILSGTLATNADDRFGHSVAINSTGDRIIVGAYNDERNGQTSTKNEGLAYVFVSGASGWTEQHILSGTLATNTSDFFGWSVSMNFSGDRVVIGAINDERSGGSGSSGLAYVFASGTGGWTQQHILSGTLAVDDSDWFGYSVAINSTGDRIIVGAYNDERSGGSSGEGLAYVFVSGASGWTQQHILSGSLATDAGDRFGWSVAVNSAGDRVVVGAYLDERTSGSLGEGLAYVFNEE